MSYKNSLKDKGDTVIDIFSDDYLSDPGFYNGYTEQGFQVDPVSSNGGFVPLNADAPDNLSRAAANVQRRFNLGQTPSGRDPYVGNKMAGGMLRNNIGGKGGGGT